MKRNPVWAELKGPSPSGQPYRTWLLFTTPEGLRHYFVPSAAEHQALLEANEGEGPTPISARTLEQYGIMP